MSFKHYDLQTLGQFISAALLCLVPLTALGQGFLVDGTWTSWTLAIEGDGVSRDIIQYRWRQMKDPYRCEVEFQNSGRDFRYVISYQPGSNMYGPGKQYTGTQAGFRGVSGTPITIPDCYQVLSPHLRVTVGPVDSTASQLGPWANYTTISWTDLEGSRMTYRQSFSRGSGNRELKLEQSYSGVAPAGKVFDSNDSPTISGTFRAAYPLDRLDINDPERIPGTTTYQVLVKCRVGDCISTVNDEYRESISEDTSFYSSLELATAAVSQMKALGK